MVRSLLEDLTILLFIGISVAVEGNQEQDELNRLQQEMGKNIPKLRTL